MRPTSKMSHAHGRHASCGLRLLIPWVHSIHRVLAGGVTDVGVGSGALLAFFGLGVNTNRPKHTDASRIGISLPREKRSHRILSSERHRFASEPETSLALCLGYAQETQQRP